MLMFEKRSQKENTSSKALSEVATLRYIELHHSSLNCLKAFRDPGPMRKAVLAWSGVQGPPHADALEQIADNGH